MFLHTLTRNLLITSQLSPRVSNFQPHIPTISFHPPNPCHLRSLLLHCSNSQSVNNFSAFTSCFSPSFSHIFPPFQLTRMAISVPCGPPKMDLLVNLTMLQLRARHRVQKLHHPSVAFQLSPLSLRHYSAMFQPFRSLHEPHRSSPVLFLAPHHLNHIGQLHSYSPILNKDGLPIASQRRSSPSAHVSKTHVSTCQARNLKRANQPTGINIQQTPALLSRLPHLPPDCDATCLCTHRLQKLRHLDSIWS